MLQHLFIVRHGEYDFTTGNLTPEGRANIASLTDKIILAGGNYTRPSCVKTSPAPRADQSANIIVRRFGDFLYDKDRSLWPPERHEYEDAELDSIVNTLVNFKEYNTLVLVFHYELTSSLPNHIRERFGMNKEIPSLGKSEAVHFHLRENASNPWEILSH